MRRTQTVAFALAFIAAFAGRYAAAEIANSSQEWRDQNVNALKGITQLYVVTPAVGEDSRSCGVAGELARSTATNVLIPAGIDVSSAGFNVLELHLTLGTLYNRAAGSCTSFAGVYAVKYVTNKADERSVKALLYDWSLPVASPAAAHGESIRKAWLQGLDGFLAMWREANPDLARKALSQASVSGPNAVPLSERQLQEVQGRLKQLGLYSGKLDGKWRASLKTAITQFQKKAGLPETSELDLRTIAKLFQ